MALLFAQPSQAEEIFSPSEQKAIETIMQNYLEDNPHKVIKILEKARNVYQTTVQKDRIAENRQEIFLPNATSFVAANPEGDIDLVVFFDYRCPYCREGYPRLMEAVRADKNVRLILKELPVFGKASYEAAQAASAAARQGKYLEMHDALMRSKGGITTARIDDLARQVGLDVPRLRRDMKRAEIETDMQENLSLAKRLQLEGTPTLIMGGEILRGIGKKEELLALFEKVRERQVGKSARSKTFKY